jgi:cyclic pyranopterin monophosphate synthase
LPQATTNGNKTPEKTHLDRICMTDITFKSPTFRSAIAGARVELGDPETLAALREDRVPKGNVFAMARAAGMFAAKRTSDMIPDCHPLPIEFADIRLTLRDQGIDIEAEIHTVYKTGVEVEAMHAASVAALTAYDMLKPLDRQITITNLRLLEKRGGKGDYKDRGPEGKRAGVLVCSDSVAAGKKADKAGLALVEGLRKWKLEVDEYRVVPDEPEEIRQTLRHWVDAGIALILITGGTGLSPRDTTPETLRPMLDRTLPGVEEAMRSYGQQRTPYAMLSRSVAGTIGKTLVLALPGSTRGAVESMQAVFPALLHGFRIMEGARHEG